MTNQLTATTIFVYNHDGYVDCRVTFNTLDQAKWFKHQMAKRGARNIQTNHKPGEQFWSVQFWHPDHALYVKVFERYPHPGYAKFVDFKVPNPIEEHPMFQATGLKAILAPGFWAPLTLSSVADEQELEHLAQNHKYASVRRAAVRALALMETFGYCEIV